MITPIYILMGSLLTFKCREKLVFNSNRMKKNTVHLEWQEDYKVNNFQQMKIQVNESIADQRELEINVGEFERGIERK